MANRGGRGGHDGGQYYGGRGGGGGGGQYYGGRGGGGGGNVEGGDGRGRGYYRGGGDGGGRRGRGYYQGEGDVRGYYQGRGGDGGRGNQGRGYHGGDDGGDIRGRGRGYQGGGDVRGRGRGYDGGGDRGRGRGYQQGGNDYGRGRGGYQQQDGDNYGGGRGGRGGGGYPDWPQPVGPPLAERYATEAAQLREKFKAMDISRAEPTFPARPGFGSAGKACIVKANHFFVGLVDKGLHQYDVTVSPEPTLTGVYRAVMSRLVSEHQHTSLGGRLPAYDGRKTLYTAGELPFSRKEFEVILSDNKTGSSGHSREKKYLVAIKHVTLVSLQQLQMLMAGYSTDIPAQALQVLDIVLRDMILNERSDMGYVVVGRSFFSSSIVGSEPSHLGLGVEGWKGFYQSIRPTQSGLSLNIDMSTTAFVKAQSVIKSVQDILKKPDLRHVTGPDCQKIKKALKGVRVEVTHRGDVRRKYRISGLAGTARDLRFQSSTGVSKTVMDYFRETYKLQLRYDFLPCLDVGTTQKPIYLPMEVCNIVPGQRYQKKLDENQVSNMMQITCQQPLQREGFIRKTVGSNNYNNTKRANEFGIEVDYEPTSVQARVLPAPMLKYHPSGSDNTCNPSYGAWNMRGKKVVNGAKVVNWLCVNFCRDLSDTDVDRFCNGLSNMCRITGLSVNVNGLKLFRPLSPGVQDNIRNFCEQTHQMSGDQKIDLLLALLPDKNEGLYGEIKRICETDIGVMSQCCLRKNVLKSSPQFFANVALKINAKCGGRNSVFANIRASLPVVSDKPTIIFGADVTHPSALDDSAPSIASVVASKDWPEVTKYHGVVHAQGHREELIQGLEGIVMELLRSFEKESERRPEQLIFYRDGVSEGQFKQVLEKEIPEIEKAWKAVYNEKPCPITFIVVQKRHHTRLFPNNHSDMSSKDNSGNVLPGTVVDRQVCHPTEFDFFLCSHAGIKGTSRPTHYHVLRDDNKFTADALQSLTNNLCYTYASCTRSVSIAPPVYYAHKLAFRARFYQTQGVDVVSEASSGSTTQPGVIKALPEIKDEVKRLMFYC